MTHREQFVPDADVGPLGAEYPCPGDESGVDDVTSGRMGPFAILRFVTAARQSHGDNLGLLGGQSLTVRLGQQNFPATDGLGGFNRAHEAGATEGNQVHDRQI